MPYADPEKRKEYIKLWRERNPDYYWRTRHNRIKAIAKWRKSEKGRLWLQNFKNSERGQRIIAAAYRRHNHKLQLNLMNLLGDLCVKCGESRIEALQIDHINGGGVRERRKEFSSNNTRIRFYLRNPITAQNRLQLLCANCNWIKRDELQEYPDSNTQSLEGLRNKRYRHRLRLRVLELLGGKCCSCGCIDTRVLQIDHIHGGGLKEFTFKFKKDYYKRLRYYKDNVSKLRDKIQLLCATCNWIKKQENREVAYKYA